MRYFSARGKELAPETTADKGRRFVELVKVNKSGQSWDEDGGSLGNARQIMVKEISTANSAPVEKLQGKRGLERYPIRLYRIHRPQNSLCIRRV
jgi:hypothetical protein